MLSGDITNRSIGPSFCAYNQRDNSSRLHFALVSCIGIELFPDMFISLELAIAYHVNEALALGFNHMLLF